MLTSGSMARKIFLYGVASLVPLSLSPVAYADPARVCEGYGEAWEHAVDSKNPRTIAEARAEAQYMRALCPELLGRIDAYHLPTPEEDALNKLVAQRAPAIAKNLIDTNFRRNPKLASDAAGVMLYGIDVVSTVDERKTIGGVDSYVVHDGAIWLFSSAGNRGKFTSAPEHYMPAYGGWCAFSVAIGDIAPPSWEVFEVYKGKLYYFADKEKRSKWLENPRKFIKDADRQWATFPEISSPIPDSFMGPAIIENIKKLQESTKR